MRTRLIDVFAETALAGNQLAVIFDAAGLSTATMQAIARETNFSETTFVTAYSDDHAVTRIFTPTAELPFAGHPTIGTAWAVRQLQQQPSNVVTLQLGVGDVAVEFDDSTGIGWLTSPQAQITHGIEPALAAQLLGLDEKDLNPDYHIKSAELGPSFQLIAVRDRAALSKCRINAEAFQHYVSGFSNVPGLFVFSVGGTTKEPHFDARMFFDADGPREDPATGSANCCFAAYLKDYIGNQYRAVVAQGDDMQRPSRIYLDVNDNNIRVGGKVQGVFEGTLSVDA